MEDKKVKEAKSQYGPKYCLTCNFRLEAKCPDSHVGHSIVGADEIEKEIDARREKLESQVKLLEEVKKKEELLAEQSSKEENLDLKGSGKEEKKCPFSPSQKNNKDSLLLSEGRIVGDQIKSLISYSEKLLQNKDSPIVLQDKFDLIHNLQIQLEKNQKFLQKIPKPPEVTSALSSSHNLESNSQPADQDNIQKDNNSNITK